MTQINRIKPRLNVTFLELCATADDRLFNNIIDNPNHLLYPQLPQQNKHLYPTRRNISNRTFQISSKRTALSDKSYLTRMVLKDATKI